MVEVQHHQGDVVTVRKCPVVYAQYVCISCGSRVYWVGFSSEKLFLSCLHSSGFSRMVVRIGGESVAPLVAAYAEMRGWAGGDETMHPFFKGNPRVNELALIAMEMVLASGPVTASFLGRRVYVDVLQTRVRMWLAKRRRLHYQAACLAFAMGGHRRLGAESVVHRYLHHDSIPLIMMGTRPPPLRVR